MENEIRDVWDQVLSRSVVSENIYEEINRMILSKSDIISRTVKFFVEGSLEGRILAAQVLGQFNNEQILNNFIVTFKDQDEDVTLRSVCGYQIGFTGSEKAVPLFISVIKNDPVREIRSVAAYSLGLYQANQEITNALIEALKNEEDETVRARVAESLGALGDRLAVPALICALEDSNVNVRFFATRALGWICDHQALPALKKLAATDYEVCSILPDGGPINEEASKAIELINSSKIQTVL